MNFFGHAVVASWKDRLPAFVLGAMLPDFANMVGTRLVRPEEPALASGVAFHHRTDHVFHENVGFRELCAAARVELAELGLSRGSARAVAHVGVEILLDGVLAGDPVACDAYRAALELGTEPALAGRIGFRDRDAAPRFVDLSRFLLERGVASRDVRPELVFRRLQRALADRPRLALGHEDRSKVEVWAERSLPAVEAGASALMQELAARLL